MSNDQSILADLENKRSTQVPTLEDGFFEDIWNGAKGAATDIWDGVVGKGTESAKEAVNKQIDSYFGTEQNPTGQDSYADMNMQYQNPTVPTQNEQGKENFVKKIPPVVVGAAGTAVAKFGFKLGWVTSIAIGAGAGAAKHYLIDKKGS